MSKIYLSFGSNLGQRQKYIKDAIEKLSKRVDISKVSSFYETEPWGRTDQPKFLNLCLEATTELTAKDLLAYIKKIEAETGRKDDEKWSPREIDIDILFYNHEQINGGGLVVPHPHLHERAFVLVPLGEIAEQFVHPALNKTIGELADGINKLGIAIYET